LLLAACARASDNLVVNAMHGGGKVLVSELGATVADDDIAIGGLGSGITHLDNADANSSSAKLSTATVVQLAVTFAMGRVVGS
jgi:hypothetical protein